MILHSKEDSSVNFVNDLGEHRYVSRSPNSFIAYLSSHRGCNQSCRFCWLTQQGQTSEVEISSFDIYLQAKEIVEYAKDKGHSDVSFSFMARGDALTHSMWYDGTDIVGMLNRLAHQYKLNPTIKISTIIPKNTPNKWYEYNQFLDVDIYYSMYSIENKFRKKWMPKAKNISEALRDLEDYQSISNKQIIIHGAWIHDENDNLDEVESMINYLNFHCLNRRWNIVRFNPFDNKYKESEKLSDIIHLLKLRESQVDVISRVGPDVYASCGMFMNTDH